MKNKDKIAKMIRKAIAEDRNRTIVFSYSRSEHLKKIMAAMETNKNDRCF